MPKRPAVLAMLATLATALALTVAVAPAANAATPVRIMTLGDSITGSPGCWRALLWNRLQTNGFTNIDMVGTLGPQGCGVPYDGENEGHGGALVTAVADQNQLVGWLSATLPDIVLMHFGTNDVWSNRSTDVILAAYSKLVDQMRASNANMRILVAKIIPMNPSTCPECGARVVALDNAIPNWAAGKTTAQSPITVVDEWTGFNTATDTGDGVHPNATGDQKMSDKWYPALAAALNGTTPPPDTQAPSLPGNPVVSGVTASSVSLSWTSSTDNVGVAGYDIFRAPGASGGTFASVGTSTSATFTNTGLTAATTYRYQVRSRDAAGNLSAFTAAVSATTSASGGGGTTGCGVAYRVANAWQGAFQGEVVVTNTSAAATTAWTVTLVFPSGVTITQLWGGTFSPASGTVTVHNMSYNGSLSPSASTTFGFIANASGSAGAMATASCVPA
jgi:lysophospholipase L1-like esterase/chitodextrinase